MVCKHDHIEHGAKLYTFMKKGVFTPFSSVAATLAVRAQNEVPLAEIPETFVPEGKPSFLFSNNSGGFAVKLAGPTSLPVTHCQLPLGPRIG
jgi:hypothetical protein